MQFVFPSLAWGFLLVMVPLLVHLINLMRVRRQRWAAMEFLLESYRKHKRWVWLKQALLLASRMLIMAIMVAMLAQWVSGSRWLAIFGESVTHHYVLLDDSFSMSDTTQGGTAYQKGLNAIRSILQNQVKKGGNHQVTLIRYSRAADLQKSSMAETTEAKAGDKVNPDAAAAITADVAADLLARSVPSNPATLLERIIATSTSSFDLSCESALKLILPLIENTPNQKGLVYIVSDFRKKDWDQPTAVRSAMEQLKQRDVKFDLIDCSEAQTQNLTLDSIAPEEDSLAAGVPTVLRIQVSNHGSAVARNVQVRVKTFDYGGKSEPRPQSALSGTETELPPLVFEQIAPGESASRLQQVLFANSGSQVVQALLPDDSIAIDNRASCVLTLEQGNRVLLVDGAANKANAFFMDAALNPGGNARTGFLTERKEPDYLRDGTAEELSRYSTIVLMNLPRLDQRAIENLESFVQNGGGLALVFGDLVTDNDYLNYNRDWYREGKGLLPVPLVGPVPLAAGGEEATDLLAESHPIFELLLRGDSSPFRLVRVSKYIAIKEPESLEKKESTEADANGRIPPRVVARLRNGEPYLLDSSFGKGRVVLFLSGLENVWTNWPKNPTFVVTALKMVGYLGSFRSQATSQTVGTPIQFSYSSRDVVPEADVLLPAAVGVSNRVQVSINGEANNESFWSGSVGRDLATLSDDMRGAMTLPGVTEVWTTRLQGDRQVANFARNVSPSEGDLEKISSSDISQKLRPVEVRYRLADSIADSSNASGLSSRTTLLMAFLVLLLLFEQWLAWSASYHMPGQRSSFLQGGGK